MKLTFDSYKCWDIEEKDYPANGNTEDKIKFILGYAILAPSTFNSQPWKVEINNNTVDIYLDKTRITKKSDKTGRFAHVSIGCFIENLRIASVRFGWKTAIDYQLKSKNSFDHIATIKFSEKGRTNDKLFWAIKNRATNRSLSLNKSLPQKILNELRQLVKNEDELQFLYRSNLQKLIAISVLGDNNLWKNFSFRKEHAGWVRHNLSRRYDGMPAFGVGSGLLASFLATPVILSPIFPLLQAYKNKKALESTSCFAVLCSKDKSLDWVKLGMLYEKISLCLTLNGVAVSPMGQFIEDDEARNELKHLLAHNSNLDPQLFFRLGYPSKSVEHSPRYPVNKIILIPASPRQ